MSTPEFNRHPLEEQLLNAKAVFRGKVLENDTLFNILQAKMADTDAIDTQLPDFGLEPTLRRDKDSGTSAIGLRINRSATNKAGIISANVGIYDYLPLGQMDTTSGTTKVSHELEVALNNVGKEKSHALSILQAWQSGLNEMGTQFTEPLTIDPMTDTFELESDLSSRAYVNLPPTENPQL